MSDMYFNLVERIKKVDDIQYYTDKIEEIRLLRKMIINTGTLTKEEENALIDLLYVRLK